MLEESADYIWLVGYWCRVHRCICTIVLSRLFPVSNLSTAAATQILDIVSNKVDPGLCT